MASCAVSVIIFVEVLTVSLICYRPFVLYTMHVVVSIANKILYMNSSAMGMSSL